MLRNTRFALGRKWVGWAMGAAGLFLALGPCLPTAAFATQEKDDPFTWRWYEVGADKRVQVNLFVFYRENCPHCRHGLEFVDKLRARHDWLRVRKYETSGHRGNLELYRRMAASLERRAGTVPAFFWCGQMTLGFSSEAIQGRAIESGLRRCRDHLQRQVDARSKTSSRATRAPRDLASRSDWVGRPGPEALGLILALIGHASSEPADSKVTQAAGMTGDAADDLLMDLELPPPSVEEREADAVDLPIWGRREADELSLPALTLVLAGCDAFNPCAFFVLLSLLSLLVHARSRRRMLLVGSIFVLFSGLFYFVFMAAWLNVFLLAGHLQAITWVAGILAVAVSVINIKDYFAFQRGITLSIPEGAKPGLFDRMRKLVEATSLWPMLLGTLALAAAANSYELLCTAGFPMVFTRVLTLRELPTAAYYGYVGLYNLIYVVPLAAIVMVFTWTLGRRKLQQREGQMLKLLSGVMMLLLGLVILLQPGLLQSAWMAGLLLAGSLGLTALVILLDRLLFWSGAARHA